MVNPSLSTSGPATGGATPAAHGESVFTTRFSEEERRNLLSEDREAQLGISAILAMLIGMGMLLGIISVTLITYLGI